MMFILFSLVMRTVHQGKQFEFTKKEVARRDVQTIDEMIEKNYTMIVASNVLATHSEMEFVHR